MGLVPLDAGTIAIDGAAVVGPRAECAMVFQNFALLPWADVLANVAFGLELRGVARREREERAREWIAAVGLSRSSDRTHISFRAACSSAWGPWARALAVEPRILLMDEPFASLDEQTRRILQDDLLALLERTRKTIVLVTHGIDEALRLGDRVVLMTPHPRQDPRVALPGKSIAAGGGGPERVPLGPTPPICRRRPQPRDEFRARRGVAGRRSGGMGKQPADGPGFRFPAALLRGVAQPFELAAAGELASHLLASVLV